ncbi:MAG: ABC-type transport system involved in lipoprotein release permease component-like protein [Actinomycetia bacterium]|nr:ABC-type transport system involved in lipoprotein release permease component-like protein [Actinomycetes bacterium]
MRVTIRWIRANLHVRRTQALLSAGVVAGVVAALIVGLTLLQGTLDPWSGVFARSNGAHVWIYTNPGTDLQPLASLDDVTALAGPFETASASVVQAGKRSWLELRAMGTQIPNVGRPLLVHGRWLDTRTPNGVVLERTFAQSLAAKVGSPLNVQGLDGNVHVFSVIGIADTSDQAPYSNGGQGLALLLPAALNQVQADVRQTRQLVGLRLSDSGQDTFVAERAISVLPENSVVKISKWREVRAAMEVDDRLLGLFLALFGIVGLISAALAIGNTTGGWVLSQIQDIAVLKILGFTPRQVLRTLLLEQGVLGLAGIVTGIGVARLLTGPWVSALLPDSLTNKTAVPISAASLGLIAAGTVAVLIIATLLPAWRGSRVSPVAAVGSTPPSGRLSRLARVALLAHLPPALVLGTRDAFTRRLYAAMTIATLAVPMAMVTIGLGCLATLDNFGRHPEQIGLAGTLTVRPTGLSDEQARGLITADPGVGATYPAAYTTALLPGQASMIRARAIGTSRQPYPFPVMEGRLYRTRGEAVAGQGLLDMMHAHVGERIAVHVGGVQMNLHIVGRTIEPEANGEVLSFGLDTLDVYQDTSTTRVFSVTLRPGVSSEAVRARLLKISPGRFDVQRVPNPADRLGIIRILVGTLIGVLALIGQASLLTATSVELRDHQRNAGVLRAIGLTPRQVMATLATRTVLLALIAVLIGSAVGTVLSPWLIDIQGHDSGVGAGIGRAPTPMTLFLANALAVVMAGLTALVPARRVAWTEVTSILYGRRPTRVPHQASSASTAVTSS